MQAGKYRFARTKGSKLPFTGRQQAAAVHVERGTDNAWEAPRGLHLHCRKVEDGKGFHKVGRSGQRQVAAADVQSGFRLVTLFLHRQDDIDVECVVEMPIQFRDFFVDVIPHRISDVDVMTA